MCVANLPSHAQDYLAYGWNCREDRRGRKRQALKRRNNVLDIQLRDIQASRSWKLITALGYIRTKVLRR